MGEKAQKPYFHVKRNILSNKGVVIKVTLTTGVFFVLLLILITGVKIQKYSKTDETRAAEVAIILGAGTTRGQPTPVFCERINHGIWLYEEGYVAALIITGGYSEGNNLSDAMIAKKYAVEKGIPKDKIMIEEKSKITQENLYYAKQIMEKSNFASALVVSDPLHMKRAMLLAKDLEIKAYSSPTTTSMYRSWQTKTAFLAREIFFYLGYGVYRLF